MAELADGDFGDESIFAHLETVRELGQGAFGRATLEKSTVDGTLFVKKHVDLGQLRDDSERLLCFQEVFNLKKLDHPNIVRYVDSVMDDKQLVTVMEFAENGDLDAFIKAQKEPIPEPQVLLIVQQIASGLAYLHDEQKMIHRDLKPANIFLGKDLQVKIGDFGMARAFAGSQQQTATQCGTVLYHAPEVFKGNTSFPSDVWALGCILVELCTGKSAFDGESIGQVYQQVMAGFDCSRIGAGYSEQLRNLAQSMFNPDPATRATAQQILENLKANF